MGFFFFLILPPEKFKSEKNFAWNMDIEIGFIETLRSQKRSIMPSFTVKTGEILGFLGFNSSGKSTTMKIITATWPWAMGHSHQRHLVAWCWRCHEETYWLPAGNNPLYLDMPVIDSGILCSTTGCESRRHWRPRAWDGKSLRVECREAQKGGELERVSSACGFGAGARHNPSIWF